MSSTGRGRRPASASTCHAKPLTAPLSARGSTTSRQQFGRTEEAWKANTAGGNTLRLEALQATSPAGPNDGTLRLQATSQFQPCAGPGDDSQWAAFRAELLGVFKQEVVEGVRAEFAVATKQMQREFATAFQKMSQDSASALTRITARLEQLQEADSLLLERVRRITPAGLAAAAKAPAEEPRPAEPRPAGGRSARNACPALDLAPVARAVREQRSEVNFKPIMTAVHETSTSLKAEVLKMQSEVSRAFTLVLNAVTDGAKPEAILQVMRDNRRSVDLKPILGSVERGVSELTSQVLSVEGEVSRVFTCALTLLDEKKMEVELTTTFRRETGKDVDLTPLMRSIHENKVKVDMAPVLKAIQEDRAYFAAALDDLRMQRPQVDFEPVFEAIERSRPDLGMTSVLSAIHEVRAQVEPELLLRALREARPEADLAAMLRAVHESRVDLTPVIREIREHSAQALDFSPLVRATQDVIQKALAEHGQPAAQGPSAVLEAIRDLSPLLEAVRETRAEVAQCLEKLQSLPPDQDLAAVVKEVLAQVVEAMRRDGLLPEGQGERARPG